jgi:hypothetical protein
MFRAYRAAALDYIDAREADLSASAEAGRSKLNRLDIGVFFSVVEGGCCLLHRLAGQVVPNRQEILLQGGKVFIADQTSGSTATELYRDSVRRNCTPEAAAAVCPLVSDEAMTRHTLGHECSHPIGCSPAIDAALGVTRDLLEETKASTGGFLIGLAVDDSDLAVQDTAAVAVARVLRFMLKSRLEEPSISPYVRENLVVLHTLLESGVVSLTDQGLAVDLSRARLDGWLTLVGQFVSSILDAYQRHDRQKLTEVRLKTCGADDRGGNDAMKDIIAWVNRK